MALAPSSRWMADHHDGLVRDADHFDAYVVLLQTAKSRVRLGRGDGRKPWGNQLPVGADLKNGVGGLREHHRSVSLWGPAR